MEIMMWRDHFSPPDDPLERRAMRKAVATHLINVGLLIAAQLGDYAVGMAAVEAALEDEEITADYVQARLKGHVSDDTVRRRLKAMARRGVLTSRRQGRACFYRLQPGLCAQVMELIEGELPAINL